MRSRRLGVRLLACLSPVALTLIGVPADAVAVPKATRVATVAKIVDGDTVDVRFPGKVRPVRVRLLEVDTPERGQCWFNEATARTAALLPVGKKVRLLADKAPKDRYGRHLFYVWNAKGTFVNRNLARYGFAKAVLYKPNDKYIKVMRADQAKAKKERLRIWSGKCGPSGKTPTTGPTTRPTASPTPSASPTDSPGGGTNPRFKTCAEANRNGYGPYYKGRDPEYDWYIDRDGDGIVCER